MLTITNIVMIISNYAKRNSLLPFILFISTSIYGQSITGKITDKNNKAIDLVSITLKKDSSIIKTTLSDVQGNYSFTDILNGNIYNLSFTFIGFKNIDTTFLATISGNTINVNLQIDNTKLKTVTVTSKKPLIERKIDRLVFNVENNVNIVGSDALEVLEITPMVRVVNDVVSIVGKSDATVMVNDKIIYLGGDALRAYLKSITAETISKIEVITNPSAKYDAQGSSGLINIVTKKTKTLGYTGTLTTNLSRATYNGFNSGLTFNYNTKKIQLVANLQGAKGAGGPTNSSQIFYDNQTWQQFFNKKEFSNFIRGTYGFEMPLSKKTSMGISYNGSNSKPDALLTSNTKITNNVNTIDSILYAKSQNDILYKTKSINWHLNHNIDSLGKKITIDFDWFKNNSSQNNLIDNSNYFRNGILIPNSNTKYLSKNNQGASIYTLNTVVDIPFKKASLAFGGKLTFIRNSSDVSLFQNINNQFIIDTNNTNQFYFNENTQAAFLNYNNTFKKLEVQVGLRAEFTQTKGLSTSLSITNTNSYFNLFPTVYFTYQLNEKNSFSLNYGKRINRPSFSLFNPFRTYLDRYRYITGNPSLKPSFPNNFELSHTYNNFLTTSLSYSFSKNQLSGITLIENGSNLQIITIGNFLTTSEVVLNTSIYLNTPKWLENQTQFSLYHTSSKSNTNATLQKVSGFGGDISTVNNIILNKPKTLVGGITFTYQFPTVSGINNYMKYYWLDISGRYLLLKKKLQIGLSLRDIFKTKTVSSSEVVNNIKTILTANNDTRRFIINIRYSFGNLKIKKGQAHSNNGEEQGRAN